MTDLDPDRQMMARLRYLGAIDRLMGEPLYQAADRIEALITENERLRERIERLRKALYAAYDDEPGWCDLTRAALGETK